DGAVLRLREAGRLDGDRRGVPALPGRGSHAALPRRPHAAGRPRSVPRGERQPRPGEVDAPRPPPSVERARRPESRRSDPPRLQEPLPPGVGPPPGRLRGRVVLGRRSALQRIGRVYHQATIRSGPPLPPRIIMGSAATTKFLTGSLSNPATFSNAGTFAANRITWLSKRLDWP